MSASKDRINRKQQIEAGTDKRTKAAAEEAAKRRKTNITYAVVAALLVVFFAFIFIYNSTYPTTHTTAVTIDGEKYTAAQVNYYYSSSYMNFANTYYAYLQYGMFFDPSQSLKDQMYSEDMSWREYFLDSAVQNLTEVHVLNKAAQEAGFVLPEDMQAQYDEAVADIETGWAELGYSSLEQYINLNYGKGVTLDLLKEEMYRTYVASAYSQTVYDSYEYSDSELTDYYSEHADELDVIDYAYYDDYDGALDAQALADAVNGTDEETFAAALAEAVEEAEPISLSYQGSDLPETYAEWLLDDARVPGDAAAFADEEDGSSTVVMFLERGENDFYPVSFRHILIQAEDADEDGELSQEELNAAAEQAEDIYAQWLAGDATEGSFAELANTYSTDEGSNTTGGLYETVTPGMMVPPIDEWLFDETRQPGDTEVISYDGDNYTGTHVVFFVGQDDQTYASALAENTLRGDAYTEWMEAATEAADVQVKSLGLCGKNH